VRGRRRLEDGGYGRTRATAAALFHPSHIPMQRRPPSFTARTYLPPSATCKRLTMPAAHGSRVDEAERPSSSEACVPPPPIYDFGATELERGARLHPQRYTTALALFPRPLRRAFYRLLHPLPPAAQRGPNPAGATLSPLLVLRAAGQQVVFPVLSMHRSRRLHPR
jgi:hypothetical protein